MNEFKPIGLLTDKEYTFHTNVEAAKRAVRRRGEKFAMVEERRGSVVLGWFENGIWHWEESK
jgi:hypothetical protein